MARQGGAHALRRPTDMPCGLGKRRSTFYKRTWYDYGRRTIKGRDAERSDEACGNPRELISRMISPILQRGLEEEKLTGLWSWYAAQLINATHLLFHVHAVGINNMQAKKSIQEAQAADGVR
ncbi:uncharacterized protein CCOS01_07843 [Colletotrichum costaricense]|uniref:Uncharacterized protein n=1 Tax=Colletotrichum costaricense TaxID=1209916 RepID=A0AAJ0E0C5_9PEZI|nr:uncharacterized protein CCOS01_07843 [Colletotrichum costaricense]KAI3551597.1 hypothetical protein CSPX01_00939 [Colletotrichum filicis]KAK1527581.1 hypothetical protein CCOS01_07843 [Colletotrichum costaricense]